ncbi:hypothetical protein [Sphingosinicella sp. BN140058]|uniref:hypothetical protein n=1 Tax=Sphingosinicella sp. BN140058 TaxID=1892855 RepID=UPI0010108B34|nr:hypothetical protein [Sphingosinicella sp. BN140058]QAY75616.1 hypothetical protein ETR14_03035 [Sphingosinicella sp. BN140058]
MTIDLLRFRRRRAGRPVVFKSLIVITSMLLAACGTARHPGDDELISRFRDHRAAFEQARDFALQDAEQRERIEPDTLDGYPSLPESHRAAYRILFEQLGIETIIPYRSKSAKRWVSVSFVVSTAGIGISGSLKEIKWLGQAPPNPPIRSLDTPYDKAGYVTDTWFDAYRAIDEGWYLHVSAD